jgi:hypothetical protein
MSYAANTKTVRILFGVTAVAAVAAIVSSCGSGGGDDDQGVTGSPATIDTASVTSAVNDFGGLVAICQDGVSGGLVSARAPGLPGALLRSSAVLHGRDVLSQQGRARILALTSTPPADQLGSCGGRFGYRNYTHVNGVTTATLAFENYCDLDSDTGDKQTVNGGFSFVNTATPTDSGPITTRLEASTSTPVSIVTKNAVGATVSAQTLSLSNFKMVVGVPGGSPTAAKPNVMSLDEVLVKNDVTGKSYRETGFSVTQYENAAGNAEWMVTGRGYRSGGTYFDIATTQPMVEGPNGGFLSGRIAFTGANNSTAVATVVPGTTPQMKMTVNGVPLTSVPACVANR